MRVPLWMIALAAILVAASSPSVLDMTLPIQGMGTADLRDMFAELHNGHPHEAIDISAPKGTPVHAVVPGTIRKLFLSKAGGRTIYEFDEAETYCYYYAHLDQYAATLHEGMKVERGTVIGSVGSTGNASPATPHLHFAIFELGPEKQWWKGKAINPYSGLMAALRKQK